MARPRKQTYPLEMYLKKMKDGDIDNSADVQRKFVWKPEQINGLIRTVLIDDYIPPIILGEEDSTQLHIADGGQRSAALNLFRYGNYKITSSIEDSIIQYKKKIKDLNGKLSWEDTEFDIKNKTYEMLPDELKKKFDEYQIETVIHEHCDRKMISKYIKIYNQQVSMNISQKAYTYIYNFAEYINCIIDNDFFNNYSSFTEAEKIKGVVERTVLETVMCMFHINEWKKQTKQIAKYLNENSSKEEFEILDNNLRRLENIITDDVKDLFNSKNGFLWITIFEHFLSLGMEDKEFLKFLRAFKNGLKNKYVEEKTFDEMDKMKNTKDKVVVVGKLNILEKLMRDFLNVSDVTPIENIEAFIASNLNMDVNIISEDIDLYNDSLDELLENTVKINSKLMDKENRPSLLTMVVYSYKEDKDLDEWMLEYASKNNTYFIDQKKNYLHMKEDFENFNKNLDL